MNVFVIYGKQDSGKSTACYKLLELLVQSSAQTLYFDQPDVNTPLPPGKDFKAMLEFQQKKILITSDGDNCSIIANNINRAIAQQPDDFILAIRSRTHYKASLSKLQAGPNNHVRFFSMPESHTIAEWNKEETQTALSIFNLLP